MTQWDLMPAIYDVDPASMCQKLLDRGWEPFSTQPRLPGEFPYVWFRRLKKRVPQKTDLGVDE